MRPKAAKDSFSLNRKILH